MLVLNDGDYLAGAATDAAKVTYTLSGAEIAAGGAPTYKTLAQGQLPSPAAALYTVGAGLMAQISQAFLCNTNTAAETVTVYVNGTVAAEQIVTLNIPAGGSATLDRDGWHLYDATGALITTTVSAAPPAASHTVTTGFGSVAVGTAVQNTLGYDIVVNVSVPVTAATGGQVEVGVGPTSTPTVDPVSPALSAASGDVSFAEYVPAGYWLLVSSTGTITLGTPTAQASAAR